MSKIILHKQINNNLSVTYPADGFLDFFIQKFKKENIDFVISENIDIDNDYFNAYEFDAESGAKVNIDKAKAIHLDKFRAVRTPLLTSLDVDFMKAVESGDTDLQKEIAAKKQALRDVTKIELPNTLEEIKATWPEILGTNPF